MCAVLIGAGGEMAERFDLEDLVTFRLSRLTDTLTRAATVTYGRRFGLALTEWRVLAIISRHQPTTANELSRRSRIDKGWISRSIASLEGRGLVARTANPRDSRSMLLLLTDTGQALVERVAPMSRERHETLLADFNDAERAVFLDLMARVEGQAERLLAEAVSDDVKSVP